MHNILWDNSFIALYFVKKLSYIRFSQKAELNTHIKNTEKINPKTIPKNIESPRVYYSFKSDIYTYCLSS